MLNQTYILRINPTCWWYITLFIYVWNYFLNIFLRIFAYIFMRNIRLQYSFLVMSLFVFHIKLMLISQLENVPLTIIFWKRVENQYHFFPKSLIDFANELFWGPVPSYVRDYYLFNFFNCYKSFILSVSPQAHFCNLYLLGINPFSLISLVYLYYPSLPLPQRISNKNFCIISDMGNLCFFSLLS